MQHLVQVQVLDLFLLILLDYQRLQVEFVQELFGLRHLVPILPILHQFHY